MWGDPPQANQEVTNAQLVAMKLLQHAVVPSPTQPCGQERKPGLEKLVLGKNHLHIWTPDTFFVNEKDAHVHDQLNPNEFVRILHTGEILVSKRYNY